MTSYDQYFSDIDECDNSPCDLTSTNCVDNDGSYVCKCLDGFKPSGSPLHCDGKLYINPSLVLVQSRKTGPYITEDC